jgi:hypothetical protein
MSAFDEFSIPARQALLAALPAQGAFPNSTFWFGNRLYVDDGLLIRPVEQLGVRVVTATTTLLDTDQIVIVENPLLAQITLVAPPADGKMLTVIRGASGASLADVLILGHIRGVAAEVWMGLQAPGTSARFVSRAGTWLPVSEVGGSEKLEGYDATLVDIVNTAAETSLFSWTLSYLAENAAAVTFLEGDFLNNSGANATVRWVINVNGTTVLNTNVSAAIATNASRRPWKAELVFSNLAATNANRVSLDWRLGNSTAATVGIGSFGTASLSYFGMSNALAINTATALTIDVRATLSSANAAISLRKLIVKRRLQELL